jgi:tRNA (guanine26-N2/guanine27-N2)-dimethyltransferase
VEHDGKQYTTVQEGLAFILIPPETPLLTDPNATSHGSQDIQSVFYNPIQQYNRDLTVLAIRAFGEDYIAANEKRFRNRKEASQRKIERNKKRRRMDQSQEGGAEDGAGPAKKEKSEHNASAVHTEQMLSSVTGAKPTELTDEFDDFEDGGIADEDFFELERSMNTGSKLQNDQPNPVPASTDCLGPADGVTSPPVVPFKILDALSATGLRALRYAQELPFVTAVTANDLSPDAVSSIRLNIQHNAFPEPQKIKVTTGNATTHMHSFGGSDHASGTKGQKYTVIDLDPYGTAIPFLDAAVQALADGGLLCVTCTDSAIFNSMGYLEKTFSQYGGTPIRGDYCHEGGLRLVLHSIATAAARHGIAMEPLLSLSIDYYARVFVRLRKSPLEVKLFAAKSMIVYCCDSGCGSWKTQFLARTETLEDKKGNVVYKHGLSQGPTAAPHCEHCGLKTHLSGPMYGGPLHNAAFIQRILDMLPGLNPKTYQTTERIEGMLSTALEETTLYPAAKLPKPAQPAGDIGTGDGTSAAAAARFSRTPEAIVDPHPFYVFPSSLARVLRCMAPSVAQFKGALRHAGYRAVRSHAKPGTIKTDAPWHVLWQIMGEWVKQKSPVEEGKMKKNTAGWKILEKWAWDRPEPAVDEGWVEVLREDGELKVVHEEGVGWKVLRKTKAVSDTRGHDERTAEAESKRKLGQGIVFDEVLGNKDKQRNGLVRYQQNPRENWGPMAKAKSKAK